MQFTLVALASLIALAIASPIAMPAAAEGKLLGLPTSPNTNGPRDASTCLSQSLYY